MYLMTDVDCLCSSGDDENLNLKSSASVLMSQSAFTIDVGVMSTTVTGAVAGQCSDDHHTVCAPLQLQQCLDVTACSTLQHVDSLQWPIVLTWDPHQVPVSLSFTPVTREASQQILTGHFFQKTKVAGWTASKMWFAVVQNKKISLHNSFKMMMQPQLLSSASMPTLSSPEGLIAKYTKLRS